MKSESTLGHAIMNWWDSMIHVGPSSASAFAAIASVWVAHRVSRISAQQRDAALMPARLEVHKVVWRIRDIVHGPWTVGPASAVFDDPNGILPVKRELEMQIDSARMLLGEEYVHRMLELEQALQHWIDAIERANPPEFHAAEALNRGGAVRGLEDRIRQLVSDLDHEFVRVAGVKLRASGGC